jgi:hypothetical protein
LESPNQERTFAYFGTDGNLLAVNPSVLNSLLMLRKKSGVRLLGPHVNDH